MQEPQAHAAAGKPGKRTQRATRAQRCWQDGRRGLRRSAGRQCRLWQRGSRCGVPQEGCCRSVVALQPRLDLQSRSARARAGGNVDGGCRQVHPGRSYQGQARQVHKRCKCNDLQRGMEGRPTTQGVSAARHSRGCSQGQVNCSLTEKLVHSASSMALPLASLEATAERPRWAASEELLLAPGGVATHDEAANEAARSTRLAGSSRARACTQPEACGQT